MQIYANQIMRARRPTTLPTYGRTGERTCYEFTCQMPLDFGEFHSEKMRQNSINPAGLSPAALGLPRGERRSLHAAVHRLPADYAARIRRVVPNCRTYDLYEPTC